MKFTFKVANMRTEQDFTIYPYSGGDTVLLQSDKRFAIVNIKNGGGLINAKNKNYATSMDLNKPDRLTFEMPKETIEKIKTYLDKLNGRTVGNGILSYSNEKLFSK